MRERVPEVVPANSAPQQLTRQLGSVVGLALAIHSSRPLDICAAQLARRCAFGNARISAATIGTGSGDVFEFHSRVGLTHRSVCS